MATTVGGQRHLWLKAMWARLEQGGITTGSLSRASNTLLDQGESTTGSLSTAFCAVLQCGLHQSSLRHLPTDVVMHAFSFLDILDYLCNISLVCKAWNITTNDIIEKDSSKFKTFQNIIFNSFKSKLTQKYSLSREDLLYEMETCLAFALLHTESYNRDRTKGNKLYHFEEYPPQPLYFSANRDVRRFCYLYLLHYIWLYTFGERNPRTMKRMYVLMTRMIFIGCTLGIGYIIELFYDKFSGGGYTLQFGEDKYNQSFWDAVSVMFHHFYVHHEHHVTHKSTCVLNETVYTIVKHLVQYSRKWHRPNPWRNWERVEPFNLLNPTIRKATQKYREIYPFL
eukprot:176292_1